MPGRVVYPDQASEEAAQRAEFGRGAERTADLTQGALRGLTNSLASRGFTDAGAGGAEGAIAGDIQNAGQAELSDLIREQTIQQQQRRQQVSDRNLTADLTQRGQDVEGRGQDFELMNSSLNARAGLLSSLFNTGGIY